MDSFLDLSKTLRQLKDMPLDITSVQGTSAIFRYSALFPNSPHAQIGMKKSLTSDEKSTFFKIKETLQHTPLYVAPIESMMLSSECFNNICFSKIRSVYYFLFSFFSNAAVIQFSANSKWPKDIEAIRSIQAGFYIKLSSVLETDFKFICRAHLHYLDVSKVITEVHYCILTF